MARRVSSLLLALVFAVAAGLASDAQARRPRRPGVRTAKRLLDKRADALKEGSQGRVLGQGGVVDAALGVQVPLEQGVHLAVVMIPGRLGGGGGGQSQGGFREAGTFQVQLPQPGTGNLTMNLQGVPFDLALDLILTAVNLEKIDIYPGFFDQPVAGQDEPVPTMPR